MSTMGIGLFCELDNCNDSEIENYLKGYHVKENFDLIIQNNDFELKFQDFQYMKNYLLN